MNRLYLYGIEQAKLTASFSTCLSTHYGAVIIDPDTGFITTGRNGSPRGMEHCTDRGWCIKRELGYDHFQQDMKEWIGMDSYCTCSHAEQNALIQAGTRAKDCIMFLYGERNDAPIIPSPCFTCIKLIINAGIKSIIIRPNIEYIEIDPIKLYKHYETVLMNKVIEYKNEKEA